MLVYEIESLKPENNNIHTLYYKCTSQRKSLSPILMT